MQWIAPYKRQELIKTTPPGSSERIDTERRRIVAAAAMHVPLTVFAGAAASFPLIAGAQTPSQASTTNSAPPLDGNTPPAGFFALSKTLTGHPELNPVLTTAAWQALAARETDFIARYKQLAAAMNAGSLSSVANEPALKSTAMAIIGAWYLGRVGTVRPRSEDGPAFITYTGALMWRPTVDVTVIPTYSRGGPGHWASVPPTLASD